MYNVILFSFVFGLEINACNVFSERSRSIFQRAKQMNLITDIVKGFFFFFLMECAVISAAKRRISFFALHITCSENELQN